MDSECQSLVTLPRLQQVPAEYSQLCYQFGNGEEPLSDNDLLEIVDCPHWSIWVKVIVSPEL